MPIDLSGNIDRFEADDVRQFNYVDQVSVPSCVSFAAYDPAGSLLQPGVTVTVSGGDITKGMHFVFMQMPSSRGFYTYEWHAFGSGSVQSSLHSTTRGMFEIIKTEPMSFLTYGNKITVMRVAQQLIGRGDLTEYDVQPHMEAAQSYINGRLGGLVNVPLVPCPAYIKQGEEILAIYTLYGEFGANDKNEIPPSFKQLRDDFVLYLDNVLKGEESIEGVPSQAGSIVYFNGGIEGGKETFGRIPFEEQSVDYEILHFERDEKN